MLLEMLYVRSGYLNGKSSIELRLPMMVAPYVVGDAMPSISISHWQLDRQVEAANNGNT